MTLIIMNVMHFFCFVQDVDIMCRSVKCCNTNVFQLKMVLSSVVLPNVVLLSVIILSVILLSVIVLSVLMLNVVLPKLSAHLNQVELRC